MCRPIYFLEMCVWRIDRKEIMCHSHGLYVPEYGVLRTPTSMCVGAVLWITKHPELNQ